MVRMTWSLKNPGRDVCRFSDQKTPCKHNWSSLTTLGNSSGVGVARPRNSVEEKNLESRGDRLRPEYRLSCLCDKIKGTYGRVHESRNY